MFTTLFERTTNHDDELFFLSLIDKSVQNSLKADFTLRSLNRNDYHKSYFDNLKALT